MNDIKLPQGTIRYSDTGKGGDPLVFIHGALVDGRLWRKVVPLLEGDHRCIVPELPLGSHTLPMPPDADVTPVAVARLVADLLEALDLRDVTLVGNDTGGAICQVVVTEHPKRVGRLVLTPCDAFEDFPPAMFKPLVLAAKVPGAMRVIGQAMRIKALRHSSLGFGALTKYPIDDAVVQSWLAPAAQDAGIRRDAVKLLAGFDKAVTMKAAGKLGSFDKPVLLAWANEDEVFKLENAGRLAEALPDARIVEIEDSLTFVSEDQPEALAKAIKEFMREPVGAAA